MVDPRIILQNKLIELGLNRKEAFLIAIEAGSSQSIVDKEYLIEEFNFSRELLEMVVDAVGRFYVGVYSYEEK